MTSGKGVRQCRGMSAAGSGTANANDEESKVHGTANVVKHCEKLPIDALDKNTTGWTICSVVSSLCNEIDQGAACGLLSTATPGFAFLTTTASVNKQFNEATTERDLISAKLDCKA